MQPALIQSVLGGSYAIQPIYAMLAVHLPHLPALLLYPPAFGGQIWCAFATGRVDLDTQTGAGRQVSIFWCLHSCQTKQEATSHTCTYTKILYADLSSYDAQRGAITAL